MEEETVSMESSADIPDERPPKQEESEAAPQPDAISDKQQSLQEGSESSPQLEPITGTISDEQQSLQEESEAAAQPESGMDAIEDEKQRLQEESEAAPQTEPITGTAPDVQKSLQEESEAAPQPESGMDAIEDEQQPLQEESEAAPQPEPSTDAIADEQQPLQEESEAAPQTEPISGTAPDVQKSLQEESEAAPQPESGMDAIEDEQQPLQEESEAAPQPEWNMDAIADEQQPLQEQGEPSLQPEPSTYTIDNDFAEHIPQGPPRIFKKVPIFIVEDHNDVLRFLRRSIGSRHLPMNGNCIIHFDSHPDLCIPKLMPAEVVYNKQVLMDNISIENWLIPMVYAGHVHRVVWVAPPWSHQIPKGKHHFYVGEYNGYIRSDCPLEYFVSEGLYQPEENLNRKKPLTLEVCAVEEYNVAEDADLPNGYILDIDLDYFSTHNPFLKVYHKVNLFEKLKEIFVSPELADSAGNSLERLQVLAPLREQKLLFLKSIFLYLEDGGTIDHYLIDFQHEEFSEEQEELLRKVSLVVMQLKQEYTESELDWSIIYDAGCITDMTELPHHESTREEILSMMKEFESFLSKLPAPPTAITIARSSCDDFTPIQQVDMIQELVLDALTKCLQVELHKPILYYRGQEYTGVGL